LPDGRLAWVVTRHADVKALLSAETTSADTTDPRFPQLMKGIFGPTGGRSLRSTDDPEHGQIRKMVAPEFTTKRINALEPGLRDAVTRTVDAMLANGSPADLHAEVSVPVPCFMICHLLGADPGAEEVFKPIAGAMMDMSVTPQDFETARRELEQFALDIVAAREKDPGNGLVGRLVVERVRTGEMTVSQLVAFMMTLMVGGHETTASSISMGVLQLLREPAKLAAVRTQPALLDAALEEMFRIQSIGDIVPVRLAIADMQVGGQLVRAGEGLIPLGAAANFDPAVWENPDEFRFDRPNPKNHLGFGAGIHACLGQNLARLELKLVFNTLLERIPTLALAVPEEELEYKWDGFVFGITGLPVRW
jgi:cytochrome P450